MPEWYVYGNSMQGQFADVDPYEEQIHRIVMANGNCTFIDPGALDSEEFDYKKTYKDYTIKDHLGNIRLKYRDARRHLWLDVVGVYHYYPYGKLIENRTWEAEDARFGFQGQERDDEVAGAVQQ